MRITILHTKVAAMASMATMTTARRRPQTAKKHGSILFIEDSKKNLNMNLFKKQALQANKYHTT